MKILDEERNEIWINPDYKDEFERIGVAQASTAEIEVHPGRFDTWYARHGSGRTAKAQAVNDLLKCLRVRRTEQ